MALEERCHMLENENQRLREIIGLKADNETWLQRKVQTLESAVTALRGELLCQ